MIRAVIFDIDGTLVDSNELHVYAWQETFRHFGKEFTRDELRRQIGKGADQYMPEFLSREELRKDGEAIEEFRGRIYKEKYIDRVKPFPKVRELFERIRRDDARIVLATSGTESELEHYKKLLKIENAVDDAISADDAERSKPHPDIFAAALHSLGDVAPREVIVVGDTPYDVEAALKIEVGTIAVRCGGFDEKTLREAGAVAIFDDVAELLARYDESPIGQRRLQPN
jgi:HAD superfamily hydrolase (TIGR01549 family)